MYPNPKVEFEFVEVVKDIDQSNWGILYITHKLTLLEMITIQ